MTSATTPAQCRLLVAGVVRNGARRMRGDLEALRRATAAFGEVHWRVIESDSTDDTPAQLAALQRDWPRFEYRSLGALRERHPLRTDRIAQARNAYLDALAADPVLAGITHVLVADLDGVCGDLAAPSLAACLAWPQDWSMCAANQGDYYYDVWALRHPQWCPGDAWAERQALLPLLGETAADELALFARMVHIAPDRAPIEVDSAFGGLALYRREALAAGRYAGLDGDGREVCEHVALHAALRAAGHRLFIHPGLINARSTRHAGRRKLGRTLRRRLWNLLRGKPWR